MITKYNIVLDIYGYIDDMDYAQKCKAVIKKLPGNIVVNIKGPIPNTEVFEKISQYHVFVLPTLGENFGHAIFEALSAGRPVLISDQTPWLQLEKNKVGWDIPLNNPLSFMQKVEEAAEWNQEEFDAYAKSAWAYTQAFIKTTELKQKYIQLFS